MLNAEEVNREMSDTYVIDVQDPGNALGCAEAYEAQFIYDAHTHRIIWGED